MTQPNPTVLQAATVTRLRNSFAKIALEVMAAPALPAADTTSVLPFTTMTAGDWRSAVKLWLPHSQELLAAVPSRPCPGCGGEGARDLFESYDGHQYRECDDCGCWFVPKRVDSALFDALFARSPEAHALAVQMMSARDVAAQRDADMLRIGRYLDDLLPLIQASPGRRRAYLDTGCGVGHSLRAGRARGLTVQGVEVDRTAIELARADGLPVAALNEPIPPGPYQLISFWETLEHIADPLAALERFMPLLAEDGLVAITVPNLNALETRTLRESCSWVHGGYNTPGHVNLFHPESMRRLLARAGLTVIEADGEFSANPENLVACLLGATRGAFDVLDPTSVRGTLPASVVQALIDVWPGIALLERLSLASPILHVVACRQGREAHFAAAMASRLVTSRARIADEARALIAMEPDYKAIAEGLEAEVARQGGVMAQLQDEVNLRDRLLEDERARYARSINGRLLRLRQLGGGAARRLGLRR